ncbi:MAG: hypothetical protein H6732_03695 [Alphaproteobacteria bacterium]|nr:hypothetical protein [Alphaproteobacteria bacterium]
MQTWHRGVVEVRWLAGALWLRHPGGGLLVDAPGGVHVHLEAAGLADKLTTLVVSTDRLRALGGLLDLWDAVARARGPHPPLHVLHPLDTERVAVVADAWSRGWGDDLALDLDGLRPGEHARTPCGVDVHLVELPLGEVGPAGAVRRARGCGLRLEVAGVTVAWVPATRAGSAARSLCAGADLAVLEVARRAWPGSDRPWRMLPEEAMRLAEGAHTAWLVGDDGTSLLDDPVH